jgi:hypothetical protein
LKKDLTNTVKTTTESKFDNMRGNLIEDFVGETKSEFGNQTNEES